MTPGGQERENVLQALRGGTFGVVDIKGEFVLARRGFSPARNAEIISRLGG
jgi:hypothetical protein